MHVAQELERLLKRKLRHKWHWLIFFIVFFLFSVTSFLKVDTDFGWHLMAGNYIWHHGIPNHDIFTYTASNFRWIDHEWLNDVIIYLIHSFSPLILMIIAAVVCMVAFLLIGWKEDNFILLLAAIAIAPYVGVRAVIWTLLGIALVLRLIRAKDKRWWNVLPMVFLAWANLHGGFVLGFFLMAYYVILLRSWRLGYILLFCMIVSLANPYGVTLYTEIFRTLFDSSLHTTIGEWASFDVVYVVWAYLVVWLTGFVLFSTKRWCRYVGLDVFMLLVALESERNWPLFVLVSLPYTSVYFRKITHYLKQPRSIRRQVVYVAFSAVLAMTGFLAIIDSYSRIYNERLLYPDGAIAYLTEHPCKGHIFNYYNYGGYLIWRLPNQKVYIDGRMPSWKTESSDYLNNYLQIFDDSRFRQDQFVSYNIQCAVLPSNVSLVYMLEKQGWHNVIHEKRYVLLE